MPDQRELEKLLSNLLEPGVFKTTVQLVEEFRAEYPKNWGELEQEGKRLFGAGCGAYQQPATRIAQALFALPENKRLCLRRNEEYSWSRPHS
jgi:hypothetical protein